MFCSRCGSRLIVDAKFCHVCGLTNEKDDDFVNIRQLEATTDQSARKRPAAAVSFEEFRERKCHERSSRFVTKKAKKEKCEKLHEVTIQIGLIRLKDGELKVVRGSTLPLKVLPTIGADELLKKAVDKIVKFNNDLSGGGDFSLLYPDRTEVRNLPGGTEPFTLQRYKEELGKPYGRITLYLCKTLALLDSVFLKSYYSDESDVEPCAFDELFKGEKQTQQSRPTTHTTTSSAVTSTTTSAATTHTITNAAATSTDNTALNSTFPGSNPQEVVTRARAVTEAHSVEAFVDLTDCSSHSIILHRAILKDSLIQAFKDPEILHVNLNVTFIGNNGKEEEGKGAGVLRDALSSFWNQFFNSLTVGAQEKVPAIRHDYQKEEWEAIGRILVYGYIREKYFPLPLSRAFVALCLFGEEVTTNDFLLSAFRLCISEDEREAFQKCIENTFLPNDDDVLDFLSSYKCFRCPTNDNIMQIVFELAHQEIIQKPRYVMNCWTPIVKSLTTFTEFKSIEALENLYDVKKPTAKKIVKLIKSEPVTEQERQSLDHLKKYIRSLQGNTLLMFLQFITGSDVIACDSIEVAFTNLEGTARRPIAHTCTPLLEIPSTYQSYNELSEEFSEILQQKDSWHFNIV